MEQQSKVNALLSQNPWHYAYNYSIKKSPPTGATHNFWPRKSRGGCGEGARVGVADNNVGSCMENLENFLSDF